MDNPIIASLEENLAHIKLVAHPTATAFLTDRGNTGNARELTVQQFIASYLTLDYQIKKGSIYSLQRVSQNIDCVVLFPNHPKLITPIREVIVAEGVYAAVEVKPDISTLTVKSEFHRGLLQMQSVKQIERERVQFPAFADREPEYFHKIPGIIFSFKSQELINTINYIRKAVADNVISDLELPDIIISIDKGIIFYCPYIKNSIFKPYLDHLCTEYPDRVIVEISETGARQLTWFLRLFLALPKPSLAMASPILYKYLEIQGNLNLQFHSLDEREVFSRRPNQSQPQG